MNFILLLLICQFFFFFFKVDATHVLLVRTSHRVKQNMNILMNNIIINKIIIICIPMCQALYLVL